MSHSFTYYYVQNNMYNNVYTDIFIHLVAITRNNQIKCYSSGNQQVQEPDSDTI